MSQTASQTIDGMVSDMMALELHFVELLAGQIGETNEHHSEVAMELTRCQDLIRDHVQALRKVRRVGSPWVGGRIAGAIKSAAAIAASLEASGIDLVRAERFPRELREGYAVAGLATMGYVMMYASAAALDDQLVALLAIRHLRDYSRLNATLLRLVPGAVVDALQEDDFDIKAEVLPEIRRALAGVWHAAEGRSPQLV